MRWSCWAPKCGHTVHVLVEANDKGVCDGCGRRYDVREWVGGGHVARLLPKPKLAKKPKRMIGWREVGVIAEWSELVMPEASDAS